VYVFAIGNRDLVSEKCVFQILNGKVSLGYIIVWNASVSCVTCCSYKAEGCSS